MGQMEFWLSGYLCILHMSPFSLAAKCEDAQVELLQGVAGPRVKLSG